MEMLGTVRVTVDDQRKIRLKPTLRDQALAHLAYTGDWVSRDRLGFLFWADTPDQTARHNVRQLLKRIRRLEWLSGFEVDGENVRWLVAADIDGLRSSAGEGSSTDIPPSGTLLPGIERGASYEFEEWLHLERHRVLAQWQDALLKAAETADWEGKPNEAVKLLEPALDEVTDETVLIRYMELAARAGDPNAAIRAYHRVTERLRSQFGLQPTDEARVLFDQLRDGANLDERASSVVGRSQETVEIMGLLARPSCRLLTLLGPGGIGKSTLADIVAITAAPRFADGVTPVSLETLSDPDSILSVIAADLEIHLDSRLDPLDQLVSVLGEREALLVVDNVEHLPHGWVWLSELERACPQLKVLVTSRERLRLEEEWVYEVGGLSPPEGAALLLQRAQQIAPDVALSEDDALSICEVVGGSPLGIELAVPWLRVMSPQEIIDEVMENPSLLSGGSRDKAIRHRSLEAAMAHSWRLLSDDERETIEALSVFVAPYTRELAKHVADVDAVRLRDLTDKSLISHREQGLYASHPLVRQYAASRLAAASDRRYQVRTRHARATLGLLQFPGEAIEHRRHLDDMIEGWLHAVACGDTELIGRAVDGFATLLVSTGRINQGLELLARAVTALDDGTLESRSVVAALKEGQSGLLRHSGRHRESAELAKAAVEAATEANEQPRLVRALISLAWARKWIEGDSAQHATLLEALPVAQSVGAEALITEVLRSLGCSAPTLEECRQYLTDALARSTSLGLLTTRCSALSSLGSVLWGLGQISEAMGLHEELLDLARSNDMVRMVIIALEDLAFLHGEIGDLERARELADEAEALCAGTEFIDWKISVGQIAGEILRLIGEPDAAQARVYESLRLVTAIGMPTFGLRSLRLHGQLLIDRGQVEEGLGLLALVCSWTRRGPDFTAWILDPRIWEENTRNAEPELVEHAKAWAEHQDLGEVVARILAQSQRSLTAGSPIGTNDD